MAKSKAKVMYTEEKKTEMRKKFEKNLVVGHNFIEELFKGSPYYFTMSDRFEPFAIIPVENMKDNSYYATGNGFVVVYFMVDNSLALCSEFQNNEQYMNYIEENPCFLYFMGCDDGSWGKSVKNKESAIEYIKDLKNLEQLLEENDGDKIYKLYKKQKVVLSEKEMKEIFDNSIVPIN